jgi:hypothetical protein
LQGQTVKPKKKGSGGGMEAKLNEISNKVLDIIDEH